MGKSCPIWVEGDWMGVSHGHRLWSGVSYSHHLGGEVSGLGKWGKSWVEREWMGVRFPYHCIKYLAAKI